MYVPLTHRVRGPHCKLQTEFFSRWYDNYDIHDVNQTRGKEKFQNLAGHTVQYDLQN